MYHQRMEYLFSFGLIFLFTASVSSSSLYSGEDRLWELDASNFENVVYGKNSAWIIQFYNSWCGHCIRFAPTWKEFALDTQMWKKVIDIGAVNCNEAQNVKLCRHYDVQSYPTIKLFWHNINDTDMGEALGGKRDILSMEVFEINFLESNWLKGVPSTWPNLTALQFSSVSEVIKSVHMNSEGLYLFIEEPLSIVGRQIILDLSFQTSVITRRVLTTNTKLLEDLGNDLYNGSTPLLIKIDKFENGEVLLRFPSNANDTYIRDQVFQFVVGHRRNIIKKNETKETSKTKQIFTDSVYMTDLDNAVFYSLRQEVGVSKNIENEKFSALKAFLLTLKLYFPGVPSTMAYLSNLYNWVSYKKRSITGEEFIKAMDNLENEKEYLPKMQDWVGCKGSQPKYRGYPCSLWTLFHTLTVQANNEFVQSQGYSENAGRALFVIRDYINYFFTCHECVENFGHMAKNLENDVNSSQNAVLWLWEAHNKVNQRLAGDMTEDPKHPKIQFPSPKLCPKCRVSGDSFDNVVWDRAHIVQYLNQFYGKQNIKKLNSRTVEDHHSVNQRLNSSTVITFQTNSLLENWNFKWFTSTDVSLCVSLYLVSAVLIVLICLIFRQRQRRRKFPFRKYLRLYP